ncbi:MULTISPECIES: YigZ family protein [Corynebacterium]|uniref:YigZ family protein n=2 Tax=Corynebacterium TaxID=1716 RepID=A0A7W2I3I9_9CORY|nr:MULTISPECIES: YigZ family protein [Corynebacterium]MBA5244040.1 YigZ family protein [Corynebacterium haemomassiliense]MCG7236273.1 YigZ family protein [Corynebacterium sp. ACRQP]MCZ9292369.1 YigZ family protein [Corynebacterium lehmanniae]
MEQAYVRPAAELVTHEFEVKRSRFIGWVARATTEEEARAVIAAAREEYPDARHHCSAFIVHQDGAQPIERSSDDGEPSGTAGKPMLEVLKGSGMQDVVAVAIRYFGGIKLGTGGLVSAYTESVADTLEQVTRVTREVRELGTVDFPHAEAGRIESELRTAGIDVVDVEYGRAAAYTLAFAPGERERVDALLAAVTHGGAEMKEAGYRWVERGA